MLDANDFVRKQLNEIQKLDFSRKSSKMYVNVCMYNSRNPGKPGFPMMDHLVKRFQIDQDKVNDGSLVEVVKHHCHN